MTLCESQLYYCERDGSERVTLLGGLSLVQALGLSQMAQTVCQCITVMMLPGTSSIPLHRLCPAAPRAK
jgi:hypothetical protein